MKPQEKEKWKKYSFAAMLLLLLCLCFSSGLTVHAAAPSVKNIQTVSGGKFIKKTKGWTYRDKKGKYIKNRLVNIKGKTYYFSRKGYRQYSWQKLDGSYYYFGKAKEGYMYKRCWIKGNGNKYYFLRTSGKRASGWVSYGGKKYYCGKNGVRLYGWQTIGKYKYYFGSASRGRMYRSTCLSSSKKLYYFDSEGHLIKTCANLKVSSPCAILVEADTGKVIYEKNADTRHANASTTKIMTCLLALEKAKLTDTVTASPYAASQEATKLYLNAGESFRMKDMLYSLMLPSHNDTAVAIAEHISGTTKKFVSLMNKKAKAIGCTSTRFATPNGLDKGLNHYTTARDLAKIAACAYKNKTFRTIVNTPSYSFRSLNHGNYYYVRTTNALLGNTPGVCGIKTGYTNKAGHCFAGAVKAKNGKTYISVSLGGSSSSTRWNDARTLLNYAYNL